MKIIAHPELSSIGWAVMSNNNNNNNVRKGRGEKTPWTQKHHEEIRKQQLVSG